jgi:hypothetical protein
MAELPEDEPPPSSTRIMFTFSDMITALLTFFVLLITFSGTSNDTYEPSRVGLLKGNKTSGMFPGTSEGGGLNGQKTQLMEGRLDNVGAEKPPMRSEAPLDQLKFYYPDVDIGSLKSLKGALVMRVPLVELFGVNLKLGADGRDVLHKIVKVAQGHPYRIVVRVNASGSDPAPDRDARSLTLGLQVVQYLREDVGEACNDIGLSNDVGLTDTPLPENHCEIVMLEV